VEFGLRRPFLKTGGVHLERGRDSNWPLALARLLPISRAAWPCGFPTARFSLDKWESRFIVWLTLADGYYHDPPGRHRCVKASESYTRCLCFSARRGPGTRMLGALPRRQDRLLAPARSARNGWI
jgi:hypothetical protein